MLVKESILRGIIRDEIIKETFGGSSIASVLIDDLREEIIDLSFDILVSPKKIVRQLIKDALGKKSTRRPIWSRESGYKRLIDMAIRLGSHIEKNLTDLCGSFDDYDQLSDVFRSRKKIRDKSWFDH